MIEAARRAARCINPDRAARGPYLEGTMTQEELIAAIEERDARRNLPGDTGAILAVACVLAGALTVALIWALASYLG